VIQLEIPGTGPVTLEHLLLDYNGTLAHDGILIPGVHERLERLSDQVQIHVLTADTFGSVQRQCAASFFSVHVIGADQQDAAKQAYLHRLGAEHTLAAGNGRNDALMLADAVLGAALLQGEGASVKSLQAADLLFTSVTDLLDALLHPNRLIATLRN
jgi:soluble P-type ATPase